jgi:hypothetical protein
MGRSHIHVSEIPVRFVDHFTIHFIYGKQTSGVFLIHDYETNNSEPDYCLQ